MCNIIPALTFLFSFLARYETVNIRNIRGLAKIAGTVLCVVGVMSMTLLRGPKILNSESALPIAKLLLGDFEDQNMWLIGCLSSTVLALRVAMKAEPDSTGENLNREEEDEEVEYSYEAVTATNHGVIG